jgi:hypothetical protein
VWTPGEGPEAQSNGRGKGTGSEAGVFTPEGGVRCGRGKPSQDKGVGSVESGQRDGDEDASHVRRATD